MLEISKLNKEDFIKNRVEVLSKFSIVEDEIKNKWDEFLKDGEEFGYSEAELEGFVKRRIISYYLKLERIPPGVEFLGIALGVNVTDFGTKRAYDNAIKKYNEDPIQAERQGYVRINEDNSITPIWKEHKFRIGGPIEIQEVKQVLMLVKRNDEKADNDFRIGWMNLDKGKEKQNVPLFKLMRFKARIKSSSTEHEYFLTGSMDSQFIIEQELSTEDIKKMLGNYFRGSYVSISELRGHHELNKENAGRYVITGGDVVDMYLTEGDKSNVLVLNNGQDGSSMLTCWLSKHPELDITFDDSAIDVIVIGRTNENQEGDLTLTVMGYYVDGKFRNGKPKPLPNGG